MTSNLIIRETVGEISTNYTRKYAERREWGRWEIVREFAQNSLDATGFMFIEITPDGLLITDKGRGFNALNLLMGTTSKSECDRGKYGEGLKIACLAVLNLGWQADIHTDSMHIVPQFRTLEIEEPSTGEIVKAEIMVFRYDKVPPVGGTKVLIKGYTGDTFLERFNLETNKKIVHKKDISLCLNKPYPSYIIDEPVKVIYVRNIYVQHLPEKEHPALYSYDLFNVRLSTDRNIPNTVDIFKEIGRLWSSVADVKMIESFFKHVKAEGYEKDAKLSSDTMGKFGTGHAWVRTFNSVFPNSFLWTGDRETKLAEYHTKFQKKGVYLPFNIRSTLSYIGIDTDYDVLKRISEKLPRTPHKYTKVQEANFEYLKRIHYRLREKYFPQLSKVFIGTTDSMMGAGGKVIDGNIYIRQDKIGTMVDAIDILGHEATHIIYPELDDNTSAFFSKIGEVMAVITKVAVTERIVPPEGIVW